MADTIAATSSADRSFLGRFLLQRPARVSRTRRPLSSFSVSPSTLWLGLDLLMPTREREADYHAVGSLLGRGITDIDGC